MIKHAPMNDLDGATSPANAEAMPVEQGREETRLHPVFAPPDDLVTFVRALPVSEAVKVLRLGTGTVHRLRHGYWPKDPRKIIAAWERYQAKRGVAASSWFLRRIRPGGFIRHAGRRYTAHLLVTRTGQMLAVSRAADGGLIAQTLEMPAQRLALSLVTE